MGLNQEEGPGFVSIYLDDVIVYSETVGDHFKHLERVTEHFMKSGVKTCKCHFVCGGAVSGPCYYPMRNPTQ